MQQGIQLSANRPRQSVSLQVLLNLFICQGRHLPLRQSQLWQHLAGSGNDLYAAGAFQRPKFRKQRLEIPGGFVRSIQQKPDRGLSANARFQQPRQGVTGLFPSLPRCERQKI